MIIEKGGITLDVVSAETLRIGTPLPLSLAPYTLRNAPSRGLSGTRMEAIRTQRAIDNRRTVHYIQLCKNDVSFVTQ